MLLSESGIAGQLVKHDIDTEQGGDIHRHIRQV